MSFPLAPPADWFNQPEPDHPEPLTVEPDGRVHGHLAPWKGCHVAFGECVPPPRSVDGYRNFHVGAMHTADGDQIPVGKIMVNGKHAPLEMGLAAATQHYDDNTHVAAYVRAVDGKHGIWLSGAAKSDLSPEALRDLRANPPSGDWRIRNGRWTLVAALAVPIPGYPIGRAASAGEPTALILSYGETEEVNQVEEPRTRDYLRKRALVASGLVAAPTVFTQAERDRMAKSGVAMPDGSFPIRNCQDYMDARRSIGRAPAGKRAQVMAHISKRGKALGCANPE